MFANCQMGGLDNGFPDVCLTPSPSGAPAPFAYPNVAAGNMATPAVYNVLYMGMPAHNLASVVPMTNGDNAGVALGMASGTVMGPSRHLTAAFTYLVGGMPCTRLTSVSLQNSTNCPGARTVPSQTKLLVLAP